MNRRWIVACAMAEAVGMTAAAGAARSATGLTEHEVARRDGSRTAAGRPWWSCRGHRAGLVSGPALSEVPGRAGRLRWLAVTVLVAGVGWAAASAPAVLAGDDGVNNRRSCQGSPGRRHAAMDRLHAKNDRSSSAPTHRP